MNYLTIMTKLLELKAAVEKQQSDFHYKRLSDQPADWMVLDEVCTDILQHIEAMTLLVRRDYHRHTTEKYDYEKFAAGAAWLPNFIEYLNLEGPDKDK